MKKFIIIIFTAIVCTSAYAQYENADAVFGKITKTYTLNEDGSMSYRYYKELKLLTHVAFNRLYGETFIVYNPEFQELKINDAYTIMANGTKVETPDNAFNEVLPHGAAHSAAFNHLREMVVTHTALEVGATIYLDYTITTKPGFMPAMMGNEIIQESSPVKEMEVIVKVPSDVELYHKMYNLRTAPEIMVVGSEKVYTWAFGGLDASPKESFRGNDPETPRLVFSTQEHTGATFDWVMRQKAFDYKLLGEMETFVNEIKDPADEIKTMRSIQEEVVKNMAYDHVPMDWMGYLVRTPEEVWESNGGNQLEKAVLLASLLKGADFNAVPALVAPRKFFDKKVGCLLLFENVCVKVNTKNFGTIYLSVTLMNDQSLEYNFENDVVAPMYKNADFSIDEPGGGKNEINLEAEFKISRDMKLTGEMQAEMTGATNPFLLLQENPDQLASQVSGGMISKAEDAITVENTNPTKTEAALDVLKEDAFKEHLGFYRFEMPAMKTGFESWHVRYLDAEREDPFVLPFTIKESYAFEIEVPAGFEYVNEKLAVNLKNKAGSVKIEISPKGNRISVKRELTLDRQVISPQEYTDFRMLVNEWLDDNMKMVVFRKAVD